MTIINLLFKVRCGHI